MLVPARRRLDFRSPSAPQDSGPGHMLLARFQHNCFMERRSADPIVLADEDAGAEATLAGISMISPFSSD